MSQIERKGFRTVGKVGRFELKEKKSRFIGHVQMVPNEEAALSVLESIRAEFPDATHHVWAYIVDGRELFSDDGEPSGSSGKPTLIALSGRDLSNVICVTTRYYGGTKLGVGGLVRAYTDACVGAVEAAGIIEMVEAKVVEVVLDYSMIGTLEHFLPTLRAEITGRNFGAEAGFEIVLPGFNLPELETFVVNLTRGDRKVNIKGNRYIVWKG